MPVKWALLIFHLAAGIKLWLHVRAHDGNPRRSLPGDNRTNLVARGDGQIVVIVGDRGADWERGNCNGRHGAKNGKP
jgi:hypothetical protein